MRTPSYAVLRFSAIVLATLIACTSDEAVTADEELTQCAGESCVTSGIALVKSTRSRVGDFEVVAPRAGGGFAHYHRDNDYPNRHPNTAPAWDGPYSAGSGPIGATAMVENRNTRRLELVAREGTRLVHYSRDIAASGNRWDGPVEIARGVKGTPALVQSSRGSGSLEVVVPLEQGGLAHHYQENRDSPWRAARQFGSEAYAAAAAVSDDQGHLFVVARTGSRLVAWDDGGSDSWSGPSTVLRSGATGAPSMIFTDRYDVMVPLVAGGIAHMVRGRGAPPDGWLGPTPIGKGQATATSLIRSDYGLEVVALVDGELALTARDERNYSWSRLDPFGAEPTCTPEKEGYWDNPFPVDVAGFHAALMRNGQVVVFGFSDFDAERSVSAVYDPQTGASRMLSYPGGNHHDMMCAGQCTWPDGKLWVVGGSQTNRVSVFDPIGGTWAASTPVDPGRWYGTLTSMPNGDAFLIGGTKLNFSFDNVNNTWQWIRLTGQVGAPQPIPEPWEGRRRVIDLYPLVYVLPDGKLFVHAGITSRLFDPVRQRFDTRAMTMTNGVSRSYPGYASGVLMPLRHDTTPPYKPEVVVFGGGGKDGGQLNAETPASAVVERIDLSASEPRWARSTSLARGRVMPDAVQLPDGNVLIVGGSHTGMADAGAQPIMRPELFDAKTASFSDMCTMRVPRVYHSTALLLPDGRVIVGGRDGYFNRGPYKYADHRVEIFNPPYLFKGPRPVIASAPSAALDYGAAFSVKVSGDATDIANVVLVRPGSVTHGNNMDQRVVSLAIERSEGTSLSLRTPPHAKIAPPGYYMLFVLSKKGVPSVAKFVQLLDSRPTCLASDDGACDVCENRSCCTERVACYVDATCDAANNVLDPCKDAAGADTVKRKQCFDTFRASGPKAEAFVACQATNCSACNIPP
jgi:hypothetical protein